ncbi:glycosyltransferase family A protein (plasmid) [Aminobacter sp. NyZ550]|uniref:glycosyltransferase family 2 protein n=1 Tax=Aminobacter sp. NyZ550 TaxID=2979870 RepID=UPI0021D5B6C4|nr:glycosyltransferase family A protein [Aminobacter sp. NyZ550]WAX98156.1 glycosyltransferase family A protein [Aminobacter sp. NyZ550]
MTALPVNKFDVLFSSGSANVPDDAIAVAISLFNYETFIVECLDSVAAQIYKNVELIVVDDCSTDDGAMVVATWMEANAGRFVSISLIRHSRNRGLASTRNTACNYAKAPYVFILDADNEIYPRALARLKEALDDTGGGAAYSQLEFFGDLKRIGDGDIWRKETFINGNYVDAMALVRKDVIQQVGGYTHIEGGWEDYDFWCKLIERGIDAVFVPELLCRYRVHGNSMLRTDTNRNAADVLLQVQMRHPWLNF